MTNAARLAIVLVCGSATSACASPPEDRRPREAVAAWRCGDVSEIQLSVTLSLAHVDCGAAPASEDIQLVLDLGPDPARAGVRVIPIPIPERAAAFGSFARQCSPRCTYLAGLVTIRETVAGAHVAGDYEITLADDTRVIGSFDAAWCGSADLPRCM